MNLILEITSNKEITADDFIGCDYVGARKDGVSYLLDFETVMCFIDKEDARKLRLELINAHCELFNKAVPRFEDIELTLEMMMSMEFACVSFEVETASCASEELNFRVNTMKVEDNCKIYDIPDCHLKELRAV